MKTEEPTENGRTDVLLEFDSNDVLKQFVGDDFDSSEFCAEMLKTRPLPELLSTLDRGISRLDTEITADVNGCYDDLIAHSSWDDNLVSSVEDFHQSLLSLQSDADSLLSRVDSWYSVMVQQRDTLCRLQTACHVLRRLTRLQFLARRLTNQLSAGTRDIVKAAKTLNDIDDLDTEDLRGISVYDREKCRIDTARESIRQKADELLSTCLTNNNQLQLVTSLQVHQCLGTMSEAVQSCVDNSTGQVHSACLSVFSASASSQSTTSDAREGSMLAERASSGLRSTVWPAVEALVSTMHVQLAKIMFLQKVLSKKRDLFGEEVQLDSLIDTFVQKAINDIAQCIVTGSNDNPRIRLILETEFPKLLRHFSDMFAKMTNSLKNSTLLFSGDLLTSVFEGVRAAVSPLENIYLSRSLNRLFDPINVVFADQCLPSESDVEALVKTLSSEAAVVAFDPVLSEKVNGNISKAILLYCTRCESLVATDEDAVQVTGPRSASQERNIAVANALSTLEARVNRAVLSATSTGPVVDNRDAIHAALVVLSDTCQNCLQPLLDSIEATVYDYIWSMHTVDYSSNAEVTDSETDASEPITLLHRFISQSVTVYLSGLKSDAFLRQIKNQLARRTIDLFLRTAPLIRPLGSAGKLRLAADISQLQMALQSLCDNLAEIGAPYRALRAFKPLLFQTPEQLMESPAIGSLLPFSTALLLLLGRCDLTPDLPATPAEVSGLGVSQYGQWLATPAAGEKQLLQLISESLQRYSETVQRRGLTEYTTHYPAMLQLLQKAMTQTQ